MRKPEQGEKTLRVCQAKVELELDEVESTVHVDSTRLLYYFGIQGSRSN